MQAINLEQVLNFRRAVRNYLRDKDLDTEKVKHCLQMATLSPSSSNMQLWEFYHIVDKVVIEKLAHASLSQKAVSTANQVIVFVTRQDLFRKRARQVLNFEIENIKHYSPAHRQTIHTKRQTSYYKYLMPLVYSRFGGLIGLFRKLFALSVSLFRPMVTDVSECDQRVVVHKSCALAVQTFMIAMANEGYDTCPIEGFDSRRVKQILKLPQGAEVNMIVSCGFRNENNGIRGDRFRIDFEEVYKKI